MKRIAPETALHNAGCPARRFGCLMKKNNNRFHRFQGAQGFSLIELSIVTGIVLLLCAIAIPMVKAAVNGYKLQSATTSVTGLIQATRFRAMSSGFPYQVVFTQSSSTYQTQTDSTQTVGTGLYDGNFVNLTTSGSSGSVSGTSANVTLGQSLTLQFSPSGAVKYSVTNAGVTTVSSCDNAGSPCQLTLTFATKTSTITVTGYGNTTVS